MFFILLQFLIFYFLGGYCNKIQHVLEKKFHKAKNRETSINDVCMCKNGKNSLVVYNIYSFLYITNYQTFNEHITCSSYAGAISAGTLAANECNSSFCLHKVP